MTEELRSAIEAVLEDAELVDDDRMWGYVIGMESLQKLRESFEASTAPPERDPQEPEQHVGYAARTAERFRFEHDPNEVMLRISKEAASDIVWAECFASRSPLRAVVDALKAMGIERP